MSKIYPKYTFNSGSERRNERREGNRKRERQRREEECVCER
jgi:hypothetical protein